MSAPDALECTCFPLFARIQVGFDQKAPAGCAGGKRNEAERMSLL